MLFQNPKQQLVAVHGSDIRLITETLHQFKKVGVNKEELIKILKGILKAETDLDFLLELKKDDLKRLVAMVRGSLEE